MLIKVISVGFDLDSAERKEILAEVAELKVG